MATEIKTPEEIAAFLREWGDTIQDLAKRVNVLSKPQTPDGFLIAKVSDGNFMIARGTGSPPQSIINVTLIQNGVLTPVQLALAIINTTS